MTTTPDPTRGVPRHPGNSTFTPRADHNSLADWVLANVDAAVANFAALPLTDNTEGKRRWLTDEKRWVVFTGGSWQRGEWTHRQLDTANAVALSITQRGIGKVTGNGAVQVVKAVTLPTPFVNDSYQVFVTPTGYRATGAFNPAGMGNASTNFASVVSKTTTGFSVLMTVPSGTLATTLDYYYDWIAVGEV